MGIPPTDYQTGSDFQAAIDRCIIKSRHPLAPLWTSFMYSDENSWGDLHNQQHLLY